ncbi:MAG TPA: peptide deformylase, partial [Actinomycetes bacterium]
MLEIRLFGDPVLKQRSDPVTRFDAELARFGDDLLETLRAAHGAGRLVLQTRHGGHH